MGAWVKIENGVVVQKQPYHSEGFIDAPDDVVCGYLHDGKKFTAPKPVAVAPEAKEPSDFEVRLAALEKKTGLTKAEKQAVKQELMEKGK